MEAENPKAGTPQLPAAAIAALNHGNKIVAIKIVRAAHDTGLKEAKDIVEAHLRDQPALKSAYAAAQSETNRNGLLGFAALIVLALLAWYFLRKS